MGGPSGPHGRQPDPSLAPIGQLEGVPQLPPGVVLRVHPAARHDQLTTVPGGHGAVAPQGVGQGRTSGPAVGPRTHDLTIEAFQFTVLGIWDCHIL